MTSLDQNMTCFWLVLGEGGKTWWWCSFEQVIQGHLSRCWWGHEESNEEIFCKIIFQVVEYHSWSCTLQFLIINCECCTGWVKWDSAIHQLERGRIKEGGREPSQWDGSEEMGVLGRLIPSNDLVTLPGSCDFLIFGEMFGNTYFSVSVTMLFLAIVWIFLSLQLHLSKW